MLTLSVWWSRSGDGNGVVFGVNTLRGSSGVDTLGSDMVDVVVSLLMMDATLKIFARDCSSASSLSEMTKGDAD